MSDEHAKETQAAEVVGSEGNAGTTTPPPVKKKGCGCFLSGCLITVVGVCAVIVGGLIILGVSVPWLLRPVGIQARSVPAVSPHLLEEKFEAATVLTTSSPGETAVFSVSLTEDELNGLIANAVMDSSDTVLYSRAVLGERVRAEAIVVGPEMPLRRWSRIPIGVTVDLSVEGQDGVVDMIIHHAWLGRIRIGAATMIGVLDRFDVLPEGIGYDAAMGALRVEFGPMIAQDGRHVWLDDLTVHDGEITVVFRAGD